MIAIRLKTSSVGKNIIKTLSNRFYCSQGGADNNSLDSRSEQPSNFNKFNAKSFPEFSVCDSGTTGWTQVQVPISPLGMKLDLYYRKKIVEYDFDDYRPCYVYLRPK